MCVRERRCTQYTVQHCCMRSLENCVRTHSGEMHQTHQSRHDHHHTTHPPAPLAHISRSSIRPPNLPSPDSVPGPSPHHDCASQTHGKSHHTCITHRSIKVYICSTPGVDPSPSLSNRRLHRLVRSRPHPYNAQSTYQRCTSQAAHHCRRPRRARRVCRRHFCGGPWSRSSTGRSPP